MTKSLTTTPKENQLIQDFILIDNLNRALDAADAARDTIKITSRELLDVITSATSVMKRQSTGTTTLSNARDLQNLIFDRAFLVFSKANTRLNAFRQQESGRPILQLLDRTSKVSAPSLSTSTLTDTSATPVDHASPQWQTLARGLQANEARAARKAIVEAMKRPSLASDQSAAALSEKLLVRSPKMSKEFWDELHASNSKKRWNAPVALILQTQHVDRAFFGEGTEYEILQIAKTHIVILKFIDKGSDVPRETEGVARAIGRPLHVLKLRGHGNASSIQFGNGMKLDGIYSEEDIRTYDFNFLAPNAYIILEACKTGQSLAPKIAKLSGRNVMAPIESGRITSTCLSYCAKHRAWEYHSYNDANEQIVKIFSRNGIRIPCGHLDPVICKVEYFKNEALAGDASAQYRLGCLLSPTRPNEAEEWLKKAAMQGHKAAIYKISVRIGMELQRNNKDIEAFEWWLKAAELGHPGAQYLLGSGYLHGSGAIPQDLTKARHFLELAAKQGHKIAQVELNSIPSEKI